MLRNRDLCASPRSKDILALAKQTLLRKGCCVVGNNCPKFAKGLGTSGGSTAVALCRKDIRKVNGFAADSVSFF